MTKRILCQFVTLFLLGMGFGLYHKWICAVGATLFLGYLLWHIPKTWSTGPGQRAVLLVAVLCVCLGMWRGACYETQRIRLNSLLSSTDTIAFQGELYKKEFQSEKIIYYLQDVTLQGEGQEIRCPALLLYPDSDDDSIGTIFIGKAKIKPFQNRRNEGNFDQESFYNSNGIFAQLEKPQINRRLLPTWDYRQQLYELKKAVGQVYASYLPAEESGIMATIALGDRESLEPEAKDLFQMAGLSHILAISGLHISVVGMFLYRLLRKMRMGFALAGGLSFCVVFLYAAMSGMGNSTIRAVIMYGVILMGEVLGCAYDSLTALAFAALVMTWCNPLLLENAGVWLSFGAVIGVVTVGKRLAFGGERKSVTVTECHKASGKKRIGIERTSLTKSVIKITEHASEIIEYGNIKGQICTMIGVQLVLLPLLANFYYEIPLYSIILNLLLLPFVGLLLGTGLLGGILGLFAPALVSIYLSVCHILIYVYEWLSDVSLNLPGARQIIGCPELWQVLVFYGLLYIACYKWQRWKTFAGIVIAVVILCVSPSREFEMDVLDVGQGDAIFWQSEEGVTFFVDGGSSDVKQVGKYRILPFLKYRGVRQIDYWFVSHTDEDHISGLLECMQQGYDIKHLVFSTYVVKNDNYYDLLAEAEARDIPISYVKEGLCCQTKSLQVTCLAPVEKDAMNPDICQDANAMSMALLVETEDYRALLTGDLPAEQERQLPLGRIGQVDLYKASHHGSNTSSSQEMLDIIRPKTTVISCALRNRYGHPGSEAVARIRKTGSSILYTMKSGQIKIGASICEVMLPNGAN